MEVVASYVASIRHHRYDLTVYRDPRGYFLRVYDGRARDVVPPVHLDPRAYGTDADGRPWSHAAWRGWLREGAERLLFRVRVLRLGVAPTEDAAPAAPIRAPSRSVERFEDA